MVEVYRDMAYMNRATIADKTSTYLRRVGEYAAAEKIGRTR